MQCVICASSKVKLINRMSRDGFEIPLIKCSNCGHCSQPVDSFEEIYTTGQFTTEAREGLKTPSPKKIKELDKRALKRYHYYKKYLSDADNFLEVGSSIGSFVHVLKLAGKSAEGIEPDPEYSTYSEKQYGFVQHRGLLEDFKSKSSYGLICSFHVLEHVKDPHVFLSSCKKLLKSDGKILFEFPSLDLHMYGEMTQTIWKPHVHYFTRSSVYSLFSKYFDVEKIGFYGSALYVSARNSPSITYSSSIFQRQKMLSFVAWLLVKIVPGIPLKGFSISLKQLLMQSLVFQKDRMKIWSRFWKLGIFAVKNKIYLLKEKGKGKNGIHFSYYSGWENAGDTVLSKCVRDNIQLVNSTRWTLKKVTAPVKKNTISEINKREFAVVGGGGLLLQDSNPNAISGWQWSISKQLLSQIEVPLIVYAIGYNFFLGQKPDDLFVESLNELVKKASFFSLRNQGSIKAVKALVPKELESRVIYQPCPTTIIRKVDHSIGEKVSSKNVGVNIAYDRYHLRYGRNIYKILDQVALALKKIEEMGYVIYNLCHLENDQKFELSLEKRRVKYKTVNLQYSLPSETYKVYNEMELVMGTRGHAQMIPFGLNAKIISLGSHNKLKWFLEDIDALDWFIDLNVDPDSISSRITELFENVIKSEKVRDKISEKQNELYNITMINRSKIEELIKI